MRILFANNYQYLRGGSERVMFDEISTLVADGHDVATFSAPRAGDLRSPRAFLAPAIDDMAQLSVLGKIARFPNMIANPAVRAAFDRALDEFRPDVVHFHNIYGRLTPVIAEATRVRRIPSVMTAHDYKLICPSYLRLDQGRPCSACSYGHYWPALVRRCHKGSRLYSFLYGVESFANWWKGRYDGIRAFLCPSHFMLDSLESKGIPRERLRFLPNCVEAVPCGRAREEGGYVLYAGRLSADKGVRVLLEAAAEVDVPVRIAGDGPDRGHLERFAAERKLSSRVAFLGHQTTEELSRLLDGALFVVVPSECLENAPMAVLEAFAHGKPVIGSDLGGIPEMIEPGRTGLLFPAGDARRLRDAIREMLSSEARRGEMGRAARELVEQRFSRTAHVSALVDIYREALS